MANLFWALAALLAAALLFIAYPLLLKRRADTSPDSLSDANVQLFQEHLEELQQQHQRGEISADELAALRLEMEKGLLNESSSEDQPQASRHSGVGWLLWCLLAVVPVASWLAYQDIGASEDLAIIELLEQSGQLLQTNPERAGEMRRDVLQRIEQRLEKQPDNFHYWVSSARLNVEQQQFGRALEAYRRAYKLSNVDDLTLWLEYLQTALSAGEASKEEELKMLCDRILALRPDNLMVLALRGRLAYIESDYRRAITDWSKVLRALPPEHDTTKEITGELEKARQRMSAEELAAMDKSRIQLRVAVDESLAAELQDAGMTAVLYIIARPVGQTEGPPLAVKRLPALGLPKEVTLDDSNLMLPGGALADVPEVSVVARVSRSGAVTGQSGDLQGRLETVAVGGDGIVDLVIDRKL